MRGVYSNESTSSLDTRPFDIVPCVGSANPTGHLNFAPLLLTFEVAALAVVASAVLGVTTGSLLARRRIPASDLLDGIVTAPMVLPPTVLGYYVLVGFGRGSPLG